MPGALKVNRGCPPPEVERNGEIVLEPIPDGETMSVGLGNLTQSLWEIETWVRSIRQTLEQLPPDLCIKVPPEGVFAYDPCGCRPGEKKEHGEECRKKVTMVEIAEN